MEREIRTAVIGVGYLGQHHARIYSDIKGIRLVGVVDIIKERAIDIADRFKTLPFFDYKDIMDKVDAVSIAVPTALHYTIALDFLRNGIDVLLEKPITSNISQADELIETAEKKGVILQIGHLERFNSAAMRLTGIINSPRFIESHRLGPFAGRGIDVDVILDLMIHDIDILLSLVKSQVKEVKAVGVPVISSTIDIANARLEFQDGCVANITASRVSREKVRKIRIFQSERYISLDYQNQEIIVCRRMFNKDIEERPHISVEKIPIEKEEPLKNELDAFIGYIRKRTRPIVSGKEGMEALKVALEVKDNLRYPH
ncbi:MAG: Gfo/Idh/MocA family protein [Nitrospirota bacterium]